MKRLLILVLLILSFSLSGQIVRTSANYIGVAAAGGGTPAAYTDDFEAYSNAALGGQGNWVVTVATMNVTDVSGDNRITAGDEGYSGVYYNATFANDQYSEITFDQVGGEYIGPTVRITGTGATLCGYSLAVTPGEQLLLDRITNGSATRLATVDVIVGAGDVIRLEAHGDELWCLLNGALITEIDTDGKITDNTYPTGRVGLLGYGSGTTCQIDLWEGGDL